MDGEQQKTKQPEEKPGTDAPKPSQEQQKPQDAAQKPADEKPKKPKKIGKKEYITVVATIIVFLWWAGILDSAYAFIKEKLKGPPDVVDNFIVIVPTGIATFERNGSMAIVTFSNSAVDRAVITSVDMWNPDNQKKCAIGVKLPLAVEAGQQFNLTGAGCVTPASSQDKTYRLAVLITGNTTTRSLNVGRFTARAGKGRLSTLQGDQAAQRFSDNIERLKMVEGGLNVITFKSTGKINGKL